MRRLAYLNPSAQPKSLVPRNDLDLASRYHRRMAAPRHDWYLGQWLKTLKKKQADIARDLGWNKAKVSLTASGKQPYDRDDVNAVAAYLNLRPYELLMHPDDAMALRRLRAEMIRLAHENETRDEAGEQQRVSLP
jgi:transcriptional regulator with XRE-family HTH domain